MKMLKKLLNCDGKMAISTAQKVGLAAAVGVAALAAGQMFLSDGNSNQDTVFSTQNEPEIVYVAGGTTAGEVREFAGEEEDSSLLYAQRAGKRHSFNFGQEEIEDPSANRPDFREQEQGIEAYKMDGQYEGLAANKRMNEVNGNSPDAMNLNGNEQLNNFQDRISQMVEQANAAKAQAAAAGGAATGDVQQTAAEALAAFGQNGQAGGKWGMADGMARANGSFSSTPLQAGQPGSQRSGVLNSGAGATGDASGTGDGDNSLGRTSGRHFNLTAGQRFRSMDDSLDAMQKRSADIAECVTCSSTESQKLFNDSEYMSGGVSGISLYDLKAKGTSAFKDLSAYMPDNNMPFLSASGGILEDPSDGAVEEVDAEMQAFIAARDKMEEQVYHFVEAVDIVSWLTIVMTANPIMKEIYIAALAGINFAITLHTVNKFQRDYGSYEDEDNPYSDKLKKILIGAYTHDAIIPGGPMKRWNQFKDEQAKEGAAVSSNTTTDDEDSVENPGRARTNGEGARVGSHSGGSSAGGGGRKQDSPYGKKTTTSSLALERTK